MEEDGGRSLEQQNVINLGCHVHWSGDGVSLKSHHMCCDCGVLTQQSTVKPSVLTIDE